MAELAKRFADLFSAQTAHRYVFESSIALRRTVKITVHLVPLTRHFAVERLTALAQAQGDIVKAVPEVLFVCVHNAGRSQMAAALLHHHAAGAARRARPLHHPVASGCYSGGIPLIARSTTRPCTSGSLTDVVCAIKLEIA
jgi:protein-tyrosine phosphatase-like protein